MKPNWKIAAMVVLAGSITAIAAAQNPTTAGDKAVKLKRVFKEGVSRKYKLEVKMGQESSTDDVFNLVITSIEKLVKVNKDGSADFVTNQTDMKMSFQGNEIPSPPADEQKPDKSTVLANNRTIALDPGDKNQEEMNKRIVQAMAPVFSDKELAVGETWTTTFAEDKDKGWVAGTAKDKVTGFETVGGVKCAVISHSYEEAKAGENGLMKVAATIFVDAATGDLVKAEGKANGLIIPQAGTEPMRMTFKMVYLDK